MTHDAPPVEAPIRAAIIGGGFMARTHARAIRDTGAELRAIATTSLERGTKSAVALHALRAEADTESLLAATDVDVVHVCTPNATHADYSMRAIEHGKHVVCEKPLATSATAARRLSVAARARGVVAAVPFVYRYHPMVREARARVQRGDLGRILSLDCGYLQDWMLSPHDDDWRVSSKAGGPSRAFADIGSHIVDMIEFVSGESIVRLSARTRRVFERRGTRLVDTEDLAAMIIETESGALGTLLVSQMAAGHKNALTLELHGENETLRFEQERPEELWRGLREGSQLLLRDPSTAAPDSARLNRVPAGHAMGYQDAFNGFVSDVYDAIAGGSPNGLPTFDDGYRAAVITEAVLASAREQSWVDVPR